MAALPPKFWECAVRYAAAVTPPTQATRTIARSSTTTTETLEGSAVPLRTRGSRLHLSCVPCCVQLFHVSLHPGATRDIFGFTCAAARNRGWAVYRYSVCSLPLANRFFLCHPPSAPILSSSCHASATQPSTLI